MVEVVWSFDEELHVRAFRFQRCRAPGRAHFESKEFAEWVNGRSFSDLLAVLDDRCLALSATHAKHFAGQERLAVTIVRSALKAMAVTEIAWGSDVAPRRLRALLHKSCGAKTFEIRQNDGQACVVIGRSESGEELGRAVRIPEQATELSPGRLIVFGDERRMLSEWVLRRPLSGAVAAAPMVESRPTAERQVRQRALLAAYAQ